MKVMIHKIPCSLNEIVHLEMVKNDIQSNPLIIRPENIVARDQVAALSDKASVLLSAVVFRIMNGREQTLMSIIPTPQHKNDSWINGTIEKWIDSMIIALVMGTIMAASLKNGFSRLPLM